MALMLACGMLILGVLILFSIVRSTLIFLGRYVFMNLQIAWPIWLKELGFLPRNRLSRCSWSSWSVIIRLLYLLFFFSHSSQGSTYIFRLRIVSALQPFYCF